MESEENWFPAGSEEERLAAYQYALSVAPGCKIGGWAPVSLRDVSHVTCESCGEEMAPFLYIGSCEWDAGSYSWRPVEEYEPEANPDGVPRDEADTKINIGRGYGMQIYICPTSWDQPHTEIMW